MKVVLYTVKCVPLERIKVAAVPTLFRENVTFAMDAFPSFRMSPSFLMDSALTDTWIVVGVGVVVPSSVTPVSVTDESKFASPSIVSISWEPLSRSAA